MTDVISSTRLAGLGWAGLPSVLTRTPSISRTNSGAGSTILPSSLLTPSGKDTRTTAYAGTDAALATARQIVHSLRAMAMDGRCWLTWVMKIAIDVSTNHPLQIGRTNS